MKSPISILIVPDMRAACDATNNLLASFLKTHKRRESVELLVSNVYVGPKVPDQAEVRVHFDHNNAAQVTEAQWFVDAARHLS